MRRRPQRQFWRSLPILIIPLAITVFILEYPSYRRAQFEELILPPRIDQILHIPDNPRRPQSDTHNNNNHFINNNNNIHKNYNNNNQNNNNQ